MTALADASENRAIPDLRRRQPVAQRDRGRPHDRLEVLRPRITSLAVKGRPVVAQLQPGAAPQVVVADFGGQVYTFDKLQRVYVPLTRR